jgi:hypothetical protein
VDAEVAAGFDAGLPDAFSASEDLSPEFAPFLY